MTVVLQVQLDQLKRIRVIFDDQHRASHPLFPQTGEKGRTLTRVLLVASVCRTLRAESNVPIVILTAMVEEEDRLAGLDLGADDYITKPFSPRELAARVRAVLRRSAPESGGRSPSQIAFDDIALDVERRTATRGQTLLTLTPTEFRLLTLFANDPHRIFSRDQIIDRVFGYDFSGFDRTVDAHVSNLRKKLECAGGAARYIHTIYGMGYRFADE